VAYIYGCIVLCFVPILVSMSQNLFSLSPTKRQEKLERPALLAWSDQEPAQEGRA